MALVVHIRKTLGRFHLAADFEAEAREALALLGASGCGKSMTLKCIAGIERPDEGRIELNGRVLFDSAGRIDLPPQRRRIGYLFQQFALFPNMTVAQNIAAGASAKHRAERRRTVEEMAAMLRLTGMEGKKPHQLSGGQQQRVALARILAGDPAAILLDEPFTALDSYLKWQLEQELSRVLAAFPGPCIWVSHDRDEVYRNCRRLCIMEQGRTEPPREKHALFADPGTLGAARLSGCKNYARARPAQAPNAVYLPEWGLTLDAGRPVPQDVAWVGLRVHSLRPAREGDANRIPCQAVQAIEDVFALILLLRVRGSEPDAPLLRMELAKDAWKDRTDLDVTLSPQDVLLLREKA